MSSPQFPPSTAESEQHAPLLRANTDDSPSTTGTLSGVLSRITGRRGTSMVVRETAARELSERRIDWGYSKPVVALDIIWNMSFVIVSVIILFLSLDEKPNTPIRVWIIIYAGQCLVHVVIVWLEFERRNQDGVGDDEDAGLRNQSVVTKRCESVNTLVSIIWWMLGFYWILSGGDVLLQNAPFLYWLAVVFLAFDVLFAVFCVVLACLIGIALCCCLPCIIAILYAVAGEEGASDADLSMLPKYRYQVLNEPSTGAGLMVPVETSSRYLMTERVLLHEDAECCICLNQYEDGVELHVLPCNHHFHCACITKWLKMNATCPLCKFNVLKGYEPV